MKDSRETFEKLVNAMYPRIYSFLLKLTRDSQEAADLTQDVFVRAYRVRDTRRTDLAPDGWFFQIAYRCFLDSRRTKRRRPQTVSVEALTNEAYPFDPADETPNPEQQFMANKFSEPLARALRALSEEQRQLISLANFGNMSHQELGEIFGCGSTTIKTRIHRAHVALRKHLLALGFDRAGLIKAGLV